MDCTEAPLSHCPRSLRFALFAGFVLTGIAGAAPAPVLEVTLRPLADGGDVRRVEILQRVTGLDTTPGQPLFFVPARVTYVRGQDYAAEDVVATDDSGLLPLVMDVQPDVPGAPLQWRTFTPRRAVNGVVSLRYRAEVAPALGPRRRGPSYDLRGVQGGFGGAPFSFLLMPSPSLEALQFRLHWDLSGLPAGARAVTVLGEGDATATLAPFRVNTLFFLGGQLQGYAPPTGVFRSYWIGSPPFDAAAAAAWSGRAFDALQAFFRQADTAPYTLLMRPYARPRDGGGATVGGFMLEYGRGALSDDARRIMFTHEMVHHFVGSLDGDPGSTAWFGEGLAEFYKLSVPLRAGLIDRRAFADELAVMTEAYYTSEMVATPYAEVAARRWDGGDAQAVPYNRGFVYFAALDAAVRRGSRGTRSLDDLVLAMLDSRRLGRGYGVAAWRELVGRELGPAGTADFDAMLRGDLVVPPEDAFGPCLVRSRVDRPRPRLGMSEDSFLVEPRRVTDLDPGSAAAAAGLREADEILAVQGVVPRIAHSAANVLLAPRVRIRARRDGREFEAEFSTEGPVVAVYQWRLRPVARCR